MTANKTIAATFTRIESSVIGDALYEYHEGLMGRLYEAEASRDADPFLVAELRAQLKAFERVERKVKRATEPAKTRIPKSWNRSVT